MKPFSRFASVSVGKKNVREILAHSGHTKNWGKRRKRIFRSLCPHVRGAVGMGGGGGRGVLPWERMLTKNRIELKYAYEG